MRRLAIVPRSSSWSDFVHSLICDLAPLGHTVEGVVDETISLNVAELADYAGQDNFWHAAHDTQHRMLLVERSAEILAFEAEYPEIFVQMPLFQPSAIQPILEIVDFKNLHHLRILRYLTCCQSVTSRQLVGRRMGLLLWDAGQTAHTPLMGAAVLASPRFSQRIRDSYLGWKPDFPKTSISFDPAARTIRLAGLGRMMQLSVACALPPYNLLSGAWLAALTPFTAVGQHAFEQSVRSDLDPDLAAVVTTTGKGISGSPFRSHRLGQLSNSAIEAAPGASGDLYAQIKPATDIPTLRASFERLLSAKTLQLARAIVEAEKPRRRNGEPVQYQDALAYVLKELKLDQTLFEGNEMGVHIGMLGRETLQYLTSGIARPANMRPRLDWETIVAVWTRKFLPASAGARETATPKSLADHNKARRKKHDAACAYPQDKVRLSHLLAGPHHSVTDEAQASTEFE